MDKDGAGETDAALGVRNRERYALFFCEAAFSRNCRSSFSGSVSRVSRRASNCRLSRSHACCACEIYHASNEWREWINPIVG